MKKKKMYKEDRVCEFCGRYGAIEIGDYLLCPGCYQERGSCCLEFGGNDLWNEKYNSEKDDQNNSKKDSDRD